MLKQKLKNSWTWAILQLRCQLKISDNKKSLQILKLFVNFTGDQKRDSSFMNPSSMDLSSRE